MKKEKTVLYSVGGLDKSDSEISYRLGVKKTNHW